MEFNLDAPLKTLDGQNFRRAPAEGQDAAAADKPWTIGEAAAEVAVRPQKDLTPVQSVKALMLGQKLIGGGTVTLTSEEVHLIVQGAPELFAPLIAGQIVRHFDPAIVSG